LSQTQEQDAFAYLRSDYLLDVDPPFEDEEDVKAKISGAPNQGCLQHSSGRLPLHFEMPDFRDIFRQLETSPGAKKCTPNGLCSHSVQMPSPFAAQPPMNGPPRFPGPPSQHEPEHKRPHLPHPKPVYALNATLPTLLPNHTLHVHVAQFKSLLPHGGYVTTARVNGRWVHLLDVPTRNGAVHVVKRLIRPFRKEHGPHDHIGEENADSMWAQNKREEEDHEWDDWEEWLPQWANED
jgi:hypothetical protein